MPLPPYRRWFDDQELLPIQRRKRILDLLAEAAELVAEGEYLSAMAPTNRAHQLMSSLDTRRAA